MAPCPPALSPRAPVLEVIAPDGTVQVDGVVARAAKKSASLKATLVEGGRLALRLR